MPDAEYLEARGGAWRIVPADVNGDGTSMLVYGAYEGAVACLNPETGEQLWEVALDSFPFNLAAADLDADGRDEVLVVTAGGALRAFSGDGGPLWSHHDPMPLYDVAVGRLGPGGAPRIVCGGVGGRLYALDADGTVLAERQVKPLVLRLAVADLDGDGRDEVLVLNSGSELLRFRLAEDRFVETDRFQLSVPADRRSWHNPALLFKPLAIDAGDVDGDGAPEVVLGSWCTNDHQVLCLGGEGRKMWLSEPQRWRFRGETYTEFYSTAFPRVLGELPGGDQPGVLVVTGGVVKLLDAEGETLREANGRVGFTDVALDGRAMYLGSSPNGDETIYRVRLNERWADSVESLERRGVPGEIGETLAGLRRQVLEYKGDAPEKAGPYVVRDLRVRPEERFARRFHRYVEWHRERFPYDNLRYVAGTRAVEEEPVLDENGEMWSEWQWNQANVRGAMTREEVVETARWAERNEVPVLVNMGHGCTPFLHLETAGKMLRAAPRYLEGFLSSEDSRPRTAPRYLRHYSSRLLDLCAEHGKRATTRNKAAWWMSIPAMPGAFEALFGGGRGRALLPATEDSNSRTSEINALARFGLRQAGLVPDFTVTMLGDLFSFNRYWQWEYPKHGHPYLRLLIAHTLLGGSHYEFRFKHLRRTGEGFAFSDMGRESTEIFLHMLGKGIVFTPRPEQMAGMSPVGLAVHEPDPRWVADVHNLHRPQRWRDDPALHEAVIPHNAALWGMTETPGHALQAVLLGKKRQFGHMFATPYGPFAIVPVHADLDAVAGVEQWWHTDGVELWREGGRRMRGMEAAGALRDSFESAAAALPFRPEGDDVFFHTIRLDDARYRIYAMDPAWVDPRERRVEVSVQVPGSLRVSDVLTGRELPVRDGRFALEVPAGGVCIIDAAPEK